MNRIPYLLLTFSLVLATCAAATPTTQPTSGKTFYVSSYGDDANDGLSPASA